MVTKEQAATEREFHYGVCKKYIGPRGGQRLEINTWRRNGSLHTSQGFPKEWRLSLKYGMGYGKNSFTYMTNDDAKDWHVASECVPQEVRTRVSSI